MNPTTIIDPDPHGLLDHLQDRFGYTAEWRREKAREFPDDERNIRAAELLETLAKTVSSVSPIMARRYVTLHDGDDMALVATETESEMMRLIGFHRFPDTAEEFLRDLVEDVSCACSLKESAHEVATEAADEAAKEAAHDAATEAAEEAAREAYDEAYKEAYDEAYREAYEEAHKEAYDEALT